MDDTNPQVIPLRDPMVWVILTVSLDLGITAPLYPAKSQIL